MHNVFLLYKAFVFLHTEIIIKKLLVRSIGAGTYGELNVIKMHNLWVMLGRSWLRVGECIRS